MSHEDNLFLKRFSIVIAGLVLFTVVLMVVANYWHDQLVPPTHPIREQMKMARIESPVGVYTGDEAPIQTQASESAAAGAFGGTRDPVRIYNSVCAACHTSGAAGAPKLQPDAWQGRLEKGRDSLVDNAVKGIGIMPAKGGRSDLTREQVAVTVDWMLEQVEGG